MEMPLPFPVQVMLFNEKVLKLDKAEIPAPLPESIITFEDIIFELESKDT